jgi:hypothetical protein
MHAGNGAEKHEKMTEGNIKEKKAKNQKKLRARNNVA